MNSVLKDLLYASKIADAGLTWPEHRDFNRVYCSLEKVYNIIVFSLKRVW